ncbi:MAG: hypothetical protein J6Y78_18425 [Paludibacteraceae bacterium]|nr:hypothetical protein [Paludibacteraceae bacterium]
MTHWYKYFILLLIPIVFGFCSNSSDNTQNDTEDEGFHLQISNVGDINGDGIQDSVVLEMMAFTNTDSAGGDGRQDNEDRHGFLFSLYLGKGNKQYEQIKRCNIPLASTETSITIPEKGRLVIDIENTVFEYAFRNNELYLEKYEWYNEGDPSLCLDFTKGELRTELYIDSFFHTTIPIPEDRRPTLMETTIERSMTSMFMGKYLYSYNEAFYDSLTAPYIQKSDSIKEAYRQKLNTIRMSIIDDDTLLNMKAEMGESAGIELYFLRKGLSQEVCEAIERDFLKLNSKYSYASSKATSFEEAFYKSKETWEEENTVDEKWDYSGPTQGESSEIFLITPFYENDHLVSYFFEYINTNCKDCYYLYIITYDKETAETFSWDMIRKEFLTLLKAYILGSRTDINEERIKYSECPPFINNDSLGVTYQYYEITEFRVDGRPGATIPLDEVEPYLTEEGRRFLRR